MLKRIFYLFGWHWWSVPELNEKPTYLHAYRRKCVFCGEEHSGGFNHLGKYVWQRQTPGDGTCWN